MALVKVMTEAWDHTVYLATETYNVVVLGDTEDKSFKSIGFTSLKEVAVFGIICLFNLIVFQVLRMTVFSLLAKIFLRKKKNMISFLFSCREAAYYSVSVFCCFRVFGQERWFYDLKYLWTLMENYETKPAQKFLYLVELSWYLCGIFRVWYEPRKKDFKQMLVHHAATITLLGISYVLHQLRIGVVIYTLHNVADPLLQFAKLFKYCGSELGATALFVPFALAFFVTRLIMYPMLCYYTIFFGPGYQRNLYYPSEIFSMGLLCLLIPIHTYWFYLIVKVAIKSISNNGKTDDSRSDSEDDEYVKPQKKTQ
ncbi:ceramide synthase [Chloropicon primus]|uniref:Ceramide synthase n=1 Tax=Chloropicon primus TaxID=1764295 RepID=A0A5B8MI66_9CHLO|nr:ceramide synthase [Chloropicon primus]|eukprot:QDZ20328.1 ceramide synthase [Chloropicon primus]